MNDRHRIKITPADLLTRTEAAEYLRVSVRSIDRHSSPDFRGVKPLLRVRVGGLIRFRREDLDDFVK